MHQTNSCKCLAIENMKEGTHKKWYVDKCLVNLISIFHTNSYSFSISTLSFSNWIICSHMHFVRKKCKNGLFKCKQWADTPNYFRNIIPTFYNWIAVSNFYLVLKGKWTLLFQWYWSIGIIFHWNMYLFSNPFYSQYLISKHPQIFIE